MAERKINPSLAYRDVVRGLRTKMVMNVCNCRSEWMPSINLLHIVKVQKDSQNNHSPIKKFTNVVSHLCQGLFPLYFKKKLFESFGFMKYYPKVKLSRDSESKSLSDLLPHFSVVTLPWGKPEKRILISERALWIKNLLSQDQDKKCSQCCDFSIFLSNFLPAGLPFFPVLYPERNVTKKYKN